ncbi:MAG TPA: CoA transferase, partial [Caldimonas sp.]
DGRWLAIACTSDKIFARLAVLMGCPEFAGSGKWGTLSQREADRAAVDAFVGEWTGRHTREEVLALCSAGEVPCGPLYAIDEIFADPHYKARDNIAFVNEPRIAGGQEFAVPNVMPRLTETPGRINWLGPPLGAHTEEVLEDWIGLEAAEIAALRSAGAI